MRLYLACPYASPNPVTRNDRAERCAMAAADLMQQHVVFAPILQGHLAAAHLPPKLAHDHKFWMRQCLPMLASSDVLCVLPLPGWRESRGTQEELTAAAIFRIPVVFYGEGTDRLEYPTESELAARGWFSSSGARHLL